MRPSPSSRSSPRRGSTSCRSTTRRRRPRSRDREGAAAGHARRDHPQPGDPGRGGLPVPGRHRRRDADEHPSGLGGPVPRTPRSTRGSRPCAAEIDRRGLAVDVEIDGGVKVENAQRGRRRGRDRADLGVRHLPDARPGRRRRARSPRSPAGRRPDGRDDPRRRRRSGHRALRRGEPPLRRLRRVRRR